MMTTTTYDPVQIARMEADASVLKALLVKTNAKMTYLEFGQSIGLCAKIEDWTPAHTARLALIAQGIYDREHRCRRYDARTWEHITRESGKGWTWARTSARHWDWAQWPPQPPRRRSLEVASKSPA